MSERRCEYPMGTVWTGPRECGRRAKGLARLPWQSHGCFVCGIHLNVVRRKIRYGSSEHEIVTDDLSRYYVHRSVIDDSWVVARDGAVYEAHPTREEAQAAADELNNTQEVMA